MPFFSDLAARARACLLRPRGPSGEALPHDPSSEDDVAPDPRLASSRATGGEHVVLTGDSGSVTGTGKTGTFVGQIAGDDAGYAGETGAERRRNPEGPDDDTTGSDDGVTAER